MTSINYLAEKQWDDQMRKHLDEGAPHPLSQETFYQRALRVRKEEKEVFQPTTFLLRLLDAYIEAYGVCESFSENVMVPDEFSATLKTVVRRGKEPA